MRARLKKSAEPFLEAAGEKGWVCPMCAWAQTQVEEAMAEDDVAVPEAIPAPPGVPPPAQNGDLAKRVSVLEELVARLQIRVQDAEAGLPADFSPFVVATWGAVEKPVIRRQIRAEISRVFREAAIPPPSSEMSGDGEELRSLFERFDDTLALITPGANKADYTRSLHRTIVEMTAITQLKGVAAKLHYMQKGKSETVSTFTVTKHRDLLDDAMVEQRKAWARKHQSIMTSARQTHTSGYTPYPDVNRGKGGKPGKGKGKKGVGAAQQDRDY